MSPNPLQNQRELTQTSVKPKQLIEYGSSDSDNESLNNDSDGQDLNKTQQESLL